jgi:hypothetical protein
MSRLQDVAALVYASPAVQDLTRSYTPVHLAEQSVKVAVAIRKSKADPHLTAMIFGAQSGSTLAALGESQIQAAVEQAAKAVELIETASEIAEAEEAMKMADVDPAVTGGHDLPNELVAEGEPGENKPEGNQPETEKELTPEVLAMAIADLAIATAYKKSLIAANLSTVADVLKFDADNQAEAGLEKLEGIGKVARERILEAIKSL